MQLREKVGKPQFTAMICGSRGSKSRLAEAAGAEPWMRDEKLHAVVVRSTFPSQNVQNTSVSEHVWKLRCWKNARRCGAKHISQSKAQKNLRAGSTFGSCYVEKAHAVVARSRFRGQNVTNTTFSDHFCTFRYVQMLFCVAGARDWAPCQKWASKTWEFSSISKTMAGVGHVKRIWQDAFSVAGAVQETCSSELLGGPGADFLRQVAFWSIKSLGFAEMILRDKCSTSYELASLFRGRRKTLETWTGIIAKRIGTRPSALHSTFHVWRTSRRIASFLMLSSSNWGSPAEFLRFGDCQVQKLRKSRRIAVFSSLQIDRQTGRRTEREREREIDR